MRIEPLQPTNVSLMTVSPQESSPPGTLIPDWSVVGFNEERPCEGNLSDIVAALATRGRHRTWVDASAEGWTAPPAWEWKLMLTGLDGAIDRYQQGLGSKSIWEARAAVGEAVWWVAGLAEFLRHVFPDSRTFHRVLGSTRQGRLVGGLTFLRNRTNHQVAFGIAKPERLEATEELVVEGKDGPSVITIRATVLEELPHKLLREEAAPLGMIFAALQDLPSPDRSFEERLGRDIMYREEVELRDVDAVLCAARDSFKMTLTIEFGKSAQPPQGG